MSLLEGREETILRVMGGSLPQMESGDHSESGGLLPLGGG